MRLRPTIGISLALLVMSGSAMAKSAPATERPHDAKKPLAHKAEPAKAARMASRAEKLARDRKRRLAETRRHGRAVLRTASRRRAQQPHAAAQDRPEDRIIERVRPIGAREIGTATWYGGWRLGRRTASGERLDAIHDTAAHRSLPLMSWARVTNLANGRSVIVRVNDRGPASSRRVIDLSPKAARDLRMIHSGVAPVAVEPVALIREPGK